MRDFYRPLVLMFFFMFFSTSHCQSELVFETDSVQIEALNEVVVTDSRFAIQRFHSGKQVHVITSDDLQTAPSKPLHQWLNQLPGIEVNGGKGVSGQNLGIYFRGGRNRQVLVLVDGIPVSDQSAIANDLDLNFLNTAQIERIEVIKGAAASLYGANASTGVINIILKKPQNQKLSGRVALSTGTNRTQADEEISGKNYNTHLQIEGGAAKNITFLLSATQDYTKGLSALEGTGFKPDPFNRLNLLGKIEYRGTAAFSVSGMGWFNKTRTSFDEAFSVTDAENISRNEFGGVAVKPKLKYKNGVVNLNAAWRYFYRDFKETSFPSTFNSDGLTIELNNEWHFKDNLRFLGGILLQNHQASTRNFDFVSGDLIPDLKSDNANFNSTDVYLTTLFSTTSGWSINTGARLHNHSNYQSEGVVHFNPSYRIMLNKTQYLKFYGAYNTAYVTPSLFQLFSPLFGNESLRPERNYNIELGAEFYAGSDLKLEATAFYRREKNAVLFLPDPSGFGGQYFNGADKQFVRGVETSTSFQVVKPLVARVSFTWIDLEAERTVGIPAQKWAAGLDYTLKRFGFSLDYLYTGSRRISNNFAIPRETGYSLFDFRANWQSSPKKWLLSAGVTNVFDTEYTEIDQFSTLGRNYNISLAYNF